MTSTTRSRRDAPTAAAATCSSSHQPLWRIEKSNWPKVHELLVQFNRRPVVSVEGPGAAASLAAPKVEAVFAGHTHAFTQDPVRDGIAYDVVGPTGAQVDQDALTGQMQHYTLVKVDAAGPHVALVEPGSVHAESFITAGDRAIAEKIAQFDNDTIGIQGTLDQPAGHDVGNRDQNSFLLTLALSNPLDVPLDVSIRLASTKFLTTCAQQDNVNPYTDNYDSPWELYVPYATQHLGVHEKVAYSCAMFCAAQTGEVPPPQIEFVVSFIDSKGRSVPTLLKRRLPLIPSAGVTVRDKPPTREDWANGTSAGMYAWIPSAYDEPVASPDLQLCRRRSESAHSDSRCGPAFQLLPQLLEARRPAVRRGGDRLCAVGEFVGRVGPADRGRALRFG